MADAPWAVANKRLKGIALGHKKSAGQFGVGAFALRAVPPYSFWTGGISNPLEVMEQITYLLFLRRLLDLHTLEENKSVRLGTPMARHI